MDTSKSSGTAVITGSAQGIGQAIALRLAQDGYDIALFDLHSKQTALEQFAATLTKELGRKAVIVTGDVSKEADVERLLARVVEALGGLDVVSYEFHASIFFCHHG
jgi:NAD(P)-dependent dehydrogenase (short-subunit alcohol dehydrogenase family)